MTDNEIIKALECCKKRTVFEECPVECPMYKFDGDCFDLMQIDILDLINRQKAEIKRLKEQVNLWQEEAGSVGCANEWLKASLKNAKAEAIKEYLNEVKIFCCESGLFQCEADEMLLFNYIDSLKMQAMLNANGMVGDTE